MSFTDRQLGQIHIADGSTPRYRLERGCTTNRYRSHAAVGPPRRTMAIKAGGTAAIPTRKVSIQ
jgi:hypothetical protein